MASFKDKLPDLNEIGSMAEKLFNDVKKSVTEIISDYKTKHPEPTPASTETKTTEVKAKPVETKPEEAKPKEVKSAKPEVEEAAQDKPESTTEASEDTSKTE